jgi:Cu/Ag efflux protein CusF
MRRYLAIAGLCICVAGCGSQSKQPETASAPPSAQAQPQPGQPAKFDLKGKVISVDRAAKKLTVDHGNIPGFMGAMTMAYPVKDEHLIDNLNPGDQVTAKVVSTGSEFWLEDIAAAK